MDPQNPYILKEPVFQEPGCLLEFYEEEGDNPNEVEMMNEYSKFIQLYVRNPFLFEVDNERGSVADTYQYLVQDYLYVLQCLLGKSKNDDTRFLTLHYDYFFHQFGSILERKGSLNIIKDTNKVLQDLYCFMRDGEWYLVNPLFESREEVTKLFIAFKRFYLGDPKKYLKMIEKYL